MEFVMDSEGEHRLTRYFDRIGAVLGNAKRRASFAIYALGLLADGERKSMEPIAARACGDPREVDAIHQRLGHFVTDSKWSDRKVRREASRFALEAMEARERIETWIIDDTGFLKQGTHSVGVQRQYTGSAGKITNCQIGVSLSVATRTEHVPIDFELYLPKSWTDDSVRRAEGRIPLEIGFRTKPELALVMIDRALEDGVSPGIVLADEAYGGATVFRQALRTRGLNYAVAVSATTTLWTLDSAGKRIGRVPWSAKELAEILGPKRFRRMAWRHGTGGKLTARFATCRVISAHDDGRPIEAREPQWLLMEWRDGEPAPAHFYLSTLPARTSRKQLVRIIKERWRTERVYEDMKGELGLDHFEGRRYPGWHHHISIALCCYAFVIAEKIRAFPPSAGGKAPSGADEVETGTPFRGLLHHGAADHRSDHGRVASSMSDLSSHHFTRPPYFPHAPSGGDGLTQ